MKQAESASETLIYTNLPVQVWGAQRHDKADLQGGYFVKRIAQGKKKSEWMLLIFIWAALIISPPQK